MTLFLTFVAFVHGAFAQPNWVPTEFRTWAKDHAKKYRSENEWTKAFHNYRSNDLIIKDLSDNDHGTAEYGHTKFGDLSPYEWKEQFFGRTMYPEVGKHGAHRIDAGELSAPLPESFDWRTSGAVTPVKDQSSCGSCWAESAVGNIESIWYLAHKATMNAPVPLSTEEVIECDIHDDACYGGYPKGGYEYVIEHGGIASKADYPYNVDGKTICLANQTFNQTCGDGMCDDPPLTNWCDLSCSDKTHKSVAHISAWTALPNDENQIATRLFQTGPISVGIDASGALGVLFPWLQFYKKGIANPRRCTTTIDHAVLLVGFGEEHGQKYWIVKNSWGEKWGEQGYFRLIRGIGRCGVNLMATTSVAAKNSGRQSLVV